MDNKTLTYTAQKKLTSDRRLKVKEWRKVFHENGNRKQAKVAMLIQDKIYAYTEVIIREKE